MPRAGEEVCERMPKAGSTRRRGCVGAVRGMDGISFIAFRIHAVEDPTFDASS